MLNLFYWFSGLAVIAIALVEILVSIAVIAFFSRHRGEVSMWASLFAPLLSVGGLAVGLWLLMSRFALLAGTVKDGVASASRWVSSSGSASGTAVARQCRQGNIRGPWIFPVDSQRAPVMNVGVMRHGVVHRRATRVPRLCRDGSRSYRG